VVAALKQQLGERGVDAAVLESDVLRPIFTPGARYEEADREAFYRQIAYVGALLTKHGVPVIFDATANRRRYRDQAREAIPRFLEVYVDTPLEVCMARDPKGIYRKGVEGRAAAVPGLQQPYEPPANPDLVVRGDHTAPGAAATDIVARLQERGFLTA
jgi:adenylylsulfate kinase